MSDDRGGPILVDVSDDALFETAFLERVGHPVMICHGPAHDAQCPLLTGDGCTLFDDAHGIVFELDLDLEQHRDIVKRYRQLATEKPIKVLVRPDQAVRYATFLADFEVWTRPPNAAELDGFAAEVEAADRFA